MRKKIIIIVGVVMVVSMMSTGASGAVLNSEPSPFPPPEPSCFDTGCDGFGTNTTENNTTEYLTKDNFIMIDLICPPGAKKIGCPA